MRILVVPLSHISKTLEFESDEWTSSSYTSTNDVDIEDEEDVDVLVMDILPTPLVEYAKQFIEEEVEHRL